MLHGFFTEDEKQCVNKINRSQEKAMTEALEEVLVSFAKQVK